MSNTNRSRPRRQQCSRRPRPPSGGPVRPHPRNPSHPAVGGNGNGDDDAARKSLEQLAQEDPDAQEGPEQFRLFGTAPRINGSVKGPRITSAAVKFKAKREKLPGQFDMGEVVRGTFVGTVVDIQFPAKKNSDGSLDVTRVHVIALDQINQSEDVPEKFAEIDGRMEAMKRV